MNTARNGNPDKPGNREQSSSRTTRHFASVEHLSAEAVAAYVDGELGRGARHRAQVHLVHCEECRADVAAQRQAADRLRQATAASDNDLCVPNALLDKLRGLEESCPQGPGPDAVFLEQPRSLGDKVELFYRAVVRSRKL